MSRVRLSYFIYYSYTSERPAKSKIHTFVRSSETGTLQFVQIILKIRIIDLQEMFQI